METNIEVDSDATKSKDSDSWISRLRHSLWGYDYFISYHWASGGKYAVALAQRLRDRGYDCFLDRAEYAVGDDWLKVGKLALQNTQRLIVIATTEAVYESKPVQLEVLQFEKKASHIIPVFFGDSTDSMSTVTTILSDAKLRIVESPNRLRKRPSIFVVKRIIESNRILKRRTLRGRIVLGVTLVLLLALLAALSFGLQAINALRHEQEANRLATARELTTASRSTQLDDPQVSALLAMHGAKLFADANKRTPFFVSAAILQALQRLNTIGLGRQDGTIQIAHIDAHKMYVVGVESNLLHELEVSRELTYPKSSIAIPVIKDPNLSYRPRFFSYSPQNNLLAVLGNSKAPELTVVDLKSNATQVLTHNSPEDDRSPSRGAGPSKPIFSPDGNRLCFVSQNCILQIFRRDKGSQWHHYTSVDLHPGEINPSLEDGSYAFCNEFFFFVQRSAQGVSVRWLHLQEQPSKINELWSKKIEGMQDLPSIVLRSCENRLVVSEINGQLPIEIWNCNSGESPSNEGLNHIEALSGTARLLTATASGEMLLLQRPSEKYCVVSLVHGLVRELGDIKGIQSALFVGKEDLVTLSSVANGKSLFRWRLGLGLEKEDSPGKLIDVFNDAVLAERQAEGGQFLVYPYSATGVQVSRIYKLNGEEIDVEEVPLAAICFNSDLSLVSDEKTFFDRTRSAQMQFPSKFKFANKSKNSILCNLPGNCFVYGKSRIDGYSPDNNSVDAVICRIDDSGICRELQTILPSCTRCSLSMDRKKMIAFNQHEFRVFDWINREAKLCSTGSVGVDSSSLSTYLPSRYHCFLKELVESKEPFVDYSLFAIDYTTGASKLVLKVENWLPGKLVWVDSLGLAIVSYSYLPRDSIEDVISKPEEIASSICENTALYSIRCDQKGFVVDKLQDVPIGGYLGVSPDGTKICILSKSAMLAEGSEIGKVYDLTRQGICRPIPIKKERGHSGIEGVSMSSNGNRIAIAGNSPAIYRLENGAYVPKYLETDDDRLDELELESSGNWALSVVSRLFQTEVKLWYLLDGVENVQQIDIAAARGPSAGMTVDLCGMGRSIWFDENVAFVNVANTILSFSLDTENWRREADHRVGRNLSHKEQLRSLGHTISPYHAAWSLPLSFEAWEGAQ